MNKWVNAWMDLINSSNGGIHFLFNLPPRIIWIPCLSSLFKSKLKNTMLGNVLMTINVILPWILALFCACSYGIICLLLLLLWSTRVSLVIFADTTLISLFKETDAADINRL